MSLNPSQQLNVFLVDDSQVDAFISRKSIENSPYINEIKTFSNTEESLNFILDPDNINDLPQLILLDINMPVLDGFEFVEAIEESELFEDNVPFTIFLLTNSKQKRDIEKFERQIIVTEFIQKPIDLDDFNECVKKLIS